MKNEEFRVSIDDNSEEVKANPDGSSGGTKIANYFSV